MRIRTLSFFLVYTFTICSTLCAHPIIDHILAGESVILRHGPLDTTDASDKLKDSIGRQISFEIDGNVVVLDDQRWFVNAHTPECYVNNHQVFPCSEDPSKLHPGHLIPQILASGIILKCDFKASRAIEPFAFTTQMLPSKQKIGHAFLWELVAEGAKVPLSDQDELLTFEDLEIARQLIGKDVPFIVGCTGFTQETLSESNVRKIAEKVAGRAEAIQFYLPGRQNISPQIATLIWEQYRLIPEIRIDTSADRLYWDSLKIPYIGTTDSPELATKCVW